MRSVLTSMLLTSDVVSCRLSHVLTTATIVINKSLCYLYDRYYLLGVTNHIDLLSVYSS